MLCISVANYLIFNNILLFSLLDLKGKGGGKERKGLWLPPAVMPSSASPAAGLCRARQKPRATEAIHSCLTGTVGTLLRAAGSSPTEPNSCPETGIQGKIKVV